MLQRDMRAWLVHEDPDAAKRYGGDAAPGLRIYQNNYRAQLVACLEESFAQTRAWIGGEAFHEAVVAHIERIPPSSWTLDAYPRDFSATLAMLYPDDPEVAELAWIECALGEAFVGPDATALSAADIADVDWDHAVLHFTPTLDLSELTTNAPAIWSAIAGGDAPPYAEILPESGAILVWRQDQISQFRAIDTAESSALLLARGGMTFSALCSASVKTHGEAAGVTLAGTLLGRWLSDGLVVGVSTTPL
jgi:hypothetical protein